MAQETVTRVEHLAWCKRRARDYLDRGDWMEAWQSFASDMSKHPDTRQHIGLELGMALLLNGHNANLPEMRKFIEGFN